VKSRNDAPPEVARADAHTTVITIRHAGDKQLQRTVAEKAAAGREEESWPDGLLSWSLFTSTDGQSLMAYEQWSCDDALDAALTCPDSYTSGIPGTEPSAPISYRLHRSHVTTEDDAPAGCIVTAVFDTDGPERQRHFIDQIFALSNEVGEMPGSIAAHFYTSMDGTRVLDYAEWSDEQSHIAVVTGKGWAPIRRRISGEIPGVRPSSYHRWNLHTTLTTV
jgi:quinol monooxygenase YgiN